MDVTCYPVTTSANGSQIDLHVIEIRGTLGDGPTVGMSAAIHGDEPTGTQILLALARRYAEGNFRGRLLLLPVANPLGFEANARNTPLDSFNLNRVFPGDANGWFSEQLAWVIHREFLQKIDVYLDFHAGGAGQTVDYIYILNAETLSRRFGSPVLYRPEEGFSGTAYEGVSGGVTVARDVPTVVVELGGGRVDQRPYVERGVRGTVNVLVELGLVDETPTPPPAQVVLNEIAIIRPHAGGFLLGEAPPLGEEVAGGAVLGRVVSPYTFEELEVIRTPFERGIMVLSHLTDDVVDPGCYGYMIGNLDSAEGRQA